MNTSDELKKIIQDKYGEIATLSLPTEKESSGCGCGSACGCNDEELYNIMGTEYQGKDGYIADADLGLGCGLPTEFAGIKQGDSVLDLGSGAGNDVFLASKLVGQNGKVVGIDMTKEMLAKAISNKERFGVENVDFVYGDIESMPLDNDSFDVVVSNCVLNLVPDKQKAFSEINRVLKSGGSFCVSDIVLEGVLPDKMKTISDFYTGCITGAIQLNDYLKVIKDTGFKGIEIHKKKEIEIADDILINYLEKDEIKDFIDSGAAIYSITVSAKK